MIKHLLCGIVAANVFCVGCTGSGNQPLSAQESVVEAIVSPSPTAIVTDEPATAKSETTATPTQTPLPTISLPAPLYLIGVDWQVWRLEADGSALTQLTSEDEKVLDYDVSPPDGRIAYVARNDLHIVNADGGASSLAADGPALTHDPDETWNWTLLESIHWSPDGKQIAYGLNGVNLITPGSDPVTLLASQMNADNTGRFYWPEAWSGDGSSLLVRITTLPASQSYGILNIATGNLTEIRKQDGSPACCMASWGSEDQSIFYASDVVFGATPGLWQATPNGITREIIPGEKAGTYFRAAYPQQFRDGMIYLFFGSSSEFIPDALPLTMARIDLAQSGDPQLMRPDSYLVAEALWSDSDDGGAVIVDVKDGELDSYSMIQRPFIGPLKWLPLDGSPTIDLAIAGRRLRWGD